MNMGLWGKLMEYFFRKMISRIACPVLVFAGMAYGQGRPPESVDPALTVSGAANTAASPSLDLTSGTSSVSAPAPSAATPSATPPSAIKPGEALMETPGNHSGISRPASRSATGFSHNKGFSDRGHG